MFCMRFWLPSYALVLIAALGAPLQAAADEPPPPDEAAPSEAAPSEAASSEAASSEAAPISYYRDVRPVLEARCQGCHQPAKAEGGLVLTSVSRMQAGGDSEQPAFVPGDPDDSLLVLQIESSDGEPPLMPQGQPPLTAEEVSTIRQWIAAGGRDDTPASAAPPIDAEHPPVYTLPPVVSALDFSPDGELLAVSGYHEVLLHRGDGSELVARLVGISPRIESLAFSPDGRYLAVTGGAPSEFGEVQIWDVAERTLVHSLVLTHDTVFGVSWSPDGKLVGFGCADNTLRAIDAASGAQVLFQGAHSDWVLGTTFATDASHLVSVSRDRSMKLTEVATERFVDNITSITPGALKGGLMCVDRHPTEDHVVAGGADGVPKIYQMYRTKDRVIGDDFNLLRAFDALPGRIFSVRFSADGQWIVAGASHDGGGEVRVYQVADGKLVARLEGQQGPVYTCTFRRDGALVASGGFDGMVRLNDPQTGALTREFLAAPLTPPDVATAP